MQPEVVEADGRLDAALAALIGAMLAAIAVQFAISVVSTVHYAYFLKRGSWHEAPQWLTETAGMLRAAVVATTVISLVAALRFARVTLAGDRLAMFGAAILLAATLLIRLVTNGLDLSYGALLFQPSLKLYQRQQTMRRVDAILTYCGTMLFAWSMWLGSLRRGSRAKSWLVMPMLVMHTVMFSFWLSKWTPYRIRSVPGFLVVNG